MYLACHEGHSEKKVRRDEENRKYLTWTWKFDLDQTLGEDDEKQEKNFTTFPHPTSHSHSIRTNTHTCRKKTDREKMKNELKNLFTFFAFLLNRSCWYATFVTLFQR